MLQLIETINNAVNNFIWGVPAMICIFGVGLYLSLRTRFLQIRKFPYAIRTTLGRMFRKRDASDGAITPFQAVCTALAATVGTGNIAGVAGAIAIGGPGAVFWMWISALLGMCTKFAEVTLAVFYHEKNANGELVGGPMYYIKNGLSKKWHFLAYLFAAFGVLTVFGTGNATQVNTITTAVNSALMNYHVISKDAIPTSNLIQGIIIAALVALILLGGVKRIAQVTEKLVPFMALFYIVLAIGVILLNLNRIPSVFVSILEGAFRPSAVTGGIVGSMLMSVKKGVSRGIFSNEAGLGTGSIAHACADTKKPVKQGMFGIFEVFTDTIVICTLTALVILCSGTSITYGQALRTGCRRRADHQRFYPYIRKLGFAAHRVRDVLLRLFHDSRMGTLRCTLHRVFILRKNHKIFYGRLCAGCHPWRHRKSRPDVEHCRDLQRPHGNPEPDCALPAFGQGCGAYKGILLRRRQNPVKFLFSRRIPFFCKKIM